jgi:hypothetical protein
MSNYRIVIDVRDVAKGDVAMLVQSILEDHGGDFDAARGDFTITAYETLGAGHFPLDLDDSDPHPWR